MARVGGKVALISGGARGMGAAHARLLIEEGARVVIGDILDIEGRKAVEQLGENARYVRLDVTKPEDWKAAVQTAVSEFGGLDVLVNNAGIANFGHIEDFSLEQWNAIVEINLTGVFLGIKAAIPALKESTAASIINISSSAGLQGFVELPGYTATKYGVRGLTKSVALDLGKYGIRVNSVHPGVIKTPMTEGMGNPMTHVALHRMGEAEEVSKMVLFLASDDSSFSSGAEFVVDGGETAGLANH